MKIASMGPPVRRCLRVHDQVCQGPPVRRCLRVHDQVHQGPPVRQFLEPVPAEQRPPQIHRRLAGLVVAFYFQ